MSPFKSYNIASRDATTLDFDRASTVRRQVKILVYDYNPLIYFTTLRLCEMIKT